MPAQCGQEQAGFRHLGNGDLLGEQDILVDHLAKEAGAADTVPQAKREAVRELDELLAQVSHAFRQPLS